MKQVFLLYENSKQNKFIAIDDYLYLSPKEYIDNYKQINQKILSYKEYIFVISYDFSKNLLLNNTSRNTKGLFICPVEQKNNIDLHIKLPIIYKKNIKLNLTKKKYLKTAKKINSDFKKGNYYLTNFTFFMKSKIKSSQKIHINDFPISDFGGYLPLPDRTLYSFSPESFLQVNKNQLTTQPIKGTLDASQNISKLIQNKKENTEQLMVVDLMRNDLSIISEFNSVRVREFQKIKKHHDLYQMYSKITSTMQDNLNFFSALMKILPAGSITGTPKYEVCKKNKVYEKKNRSYYTGIAGYYNRKTRKGFANILIRMLEIKNKKVKIGIGSGLTIESSFQKEFKECLLKGNSIIKKLREII